MSEFLIHEVNGACSFCHETRCDKKECQLKRKQRAKRLKIAYMPYNSYVNEDIMSSMRGKSRRIIRKTTVETAASYHDLY